MNPHHQHFLVMRAVEDADGAAARAVPVGAPQEVVHQLLLARAPEGVHRDAERPGAVEDAPNGAVLAAGIGALQDDEEGAPAFRV